MLQERRQKIFQGGQRKKRPKNTTIKLLPTIFLSCMKIQRGHASPPAADAHDILCCLQHQFFSEPFSIHNITEQYRVS